MTFDIRAMPEAVDAALLTALSGVEVSTLGHWRLWGICDPVIQRLFPGETVVGTAVTVALPVADSVILHRALDLVRPGDVLVIDRLGDRAHACVGGVVARVARDRGVAAIVVDGPVTDCAELAEIGLPIWCRGVSGLTTRRLGLGGRMNVPVSIAGTVIEPGDAMLCDANGVAALSPGEVAQQVTQAKASGEREQRILEALDRGESFAAALSQASGLA